MKKGNGLLDIVRPNFYEIDSGFFVILEVTRLWTICNLEKITLSNRTYVFRSVDLSMKVERCRS